MKLTLVLLIAALIQVNAAGYAQKITLSEKNVQLEQVFKKIRKQAGYNFLYNDQMLRRVPKVDIDVKEASIAEVLERCLAGQPLTYTIAQNTIIIKRMTTIPGSSFMQLAPISITGKVTDVKGGPLPGVSVKLKSSSMGVSTGFDGSYSISVPNEGGILVFSFIGMKTQEISVSNQRVIDIVMEEDVAKLSEVVVVGYGTQKKINLTGAVDQIGTEYFEDRPVPNVSRAIQGAIPNVNLRLTDGKPTRNPSYNVRGTTSIGVGGRALVLIDGVQGDPINLNPNDIETVTVLKDAASAAIYGSRGVFGVILITTKKPGVDNIRVNYATNYSINQRTTTPEWVSDGYTWAKMFNESWSSWYDYAQTPTSVFSFFPFSQGYLDELKYRSEHPGELPDITINPTNGNYVYYGNTDWISELYQNNIPAMEHSLNFSGGSDKFEYLVSGRYYQQDGIFKYSPDDFNKYNMRFKGGLQATKWLKITNNTDFSSYKYKYPLQSINKYDVWTNLKLHGFPMVKLLNPDGTLTQSAANNGVGELYAGKSRSLVKQNFMRNTVGFEAKVIKDLNIKSDFTYQLTRSEDERRFSPVQYSNKPGVTATAGSNYLNNNSDKTEYYAANLYSDYKRSFGNHNLKFLIGGNFEKYSFSNLEIQRDELILDDLTDFNLAVGENFMILAGGNDWATVGGFYRFNYDFKNKYLVEVNGRYDGSSKFPSYEQFGFFPSISAGWNIAEENFMKNTRSWLDVLKIRSSFGSLGNSQISPYQYEQAIRARRSALILNGSFPTYLQQPAVLADDFTWETSTTLNMGLDINLFKNRLISSIDVYQRKTTDMITVGQPLPAVFGAAVPRGNFADLTTKGFEVSVAWNSHIKTTKPISYGLRLTLSNNDAYIDKFYNPSNLLSTYYEGQRVGDTWGYRADGLFLSDEEIKNSPDQSFIKVSSGNKLLPGDLKFKDLNGDGVINSGKSTLDDHGDLTIIGNSNPRYTYGATTNFEWNNFSLSAFFQGVGKRDWYFGNESGIFWGQYTRWYGQIPKHTLEGTWTVDNPNPDSYFPRYRGPMTAAGRELGTPVDRYLQNVSYIRLKDLTVGYTLPKSLSAKMKVSGVRLYATGQNLFTYSPMYKLTNDIDPEVIENSDPEIRSDMGQGAAYPMLKTYTFGLNLTL